MPEEFLSHIVAEFPSLERFLSPGLELPVHIHHLCVCTAQIRHVPVYQLPYQVVVETGAVRCRHDDRYISRVLRRDHDDVSILGDLSAGITSFENLNPRDIDRHCSQFLNLKIQISIQIGGMREICI